MEKNFLELLHATVEVELNLSKLYRMFYERLDEDKELWWQLSTEEINHASLIRTGETIPVKYFPTKLLAKDVDTLIDVKNKISEIMVIYSKKELTRVTAFSLALQFEESAGEVHYQLAMTSEPDDDWMKIFKQLNGGDINHRNRIKEYMKAGKPKEDAEE